MLVLDVEILVNYVLVVDRKLYINWIDGKALIADVEREISLGVEQGTFGA